MAYFFSFPPVLHLLAQNPERLIGKTDRRYIGEGMTADVVSTAMAPSFQRPCALGLQRI